MDSPLPLSFRGLWVGFLVRPLMLLWPGLYLLVYAASGQIDIKFEVYLYWFFSIDIMAIMRIEILLYFQMIYFSFG